MKKLSSILLVLPFVLSSCEGKAPRVIKPLVFGSYQVEKQTNVFERVNDSLVYQNRLKMFFKYDKIGRNYKPVLKD